MPLEVGGRGAIGFRIIEMHGTVIMFMVLEVGGRGGDWLQNPDKCIRLSTFSWFWEAGRREAAGRSIIRDA